MNANASIARVKKLPSPEAIGNERATVEFHGASSAILLPGRRAAAWHSMLAFSQQYDLPAYVETDPETGVVTRVLLPMRATVVGLDGTAGGDVHVRLRESHAGHRLLRSNPDFGAFLDALESARVAGEAVLVTSSRDEHEILDVREAPPPTATGPPPDDPPPSVVTEAQAAQLFNDMAATTCDPVTVPAPCIPFMYSDDGCYARAHEMVRLMRLHGIEAEKIWIYASTDSSLNPAAVNHPDCEVNWWYHVAPTLQVQTAAGIEKRVIDPSLMTGPVTPDAWRLRQNDPAATFQFTDATPFWPDGTPDDASYTLTNQYLAEKRTYLADRSAEFGPPPYECPIVQRAFFVVDRSTFGQDEVSALLQGANPAIVQAALYVVVDGFTPQALGITPATLTNPPTIVPNLAVNPNVVGMQIRAAHLDLEDPVHLTRRQRVTWTYEVRWTDTTGFNFAADTRSVSVAATIAGQSANASILLIKQPNPYETDGATSWLSTDLRVFQINAGQSKFNAMMGPGSAQAPAFIQQVIDNLNAGATGGQSFDNALSTDEQASRLELSTTVGGTAVFNFALARVRYVGTLQAAGVRVFFRLFPASTTSLVYDPATTYRRGGQGGVTVPLLGLASGQLVTIPCFGSARVDSASTSLAAQTDVSNVRTIAASPTEREVFFGAWLDINQSAPQFPLSPTPPDGPFAGSRMSVYQLVRSAHQCLVAEIAFDPDPIPGGSTPGTSDKLAQRNLALVESANPGVIGSRRIPQTFEIRQTPLSLPTDAIPDELMIDWGSTPVGSVASLYLPEADSDEVLGLAAASYRSAEFVATDEHTLQTRTGGMSWLPIPRGTTNLTGLLTIDLPPTVRAGQEFRIVVHQVTGLLTPVVEEVSIAVVGARFGRRILGSFQVTIPVRTREALLVPAQRLLANLRWIERSIPPGDRWYPAFRRYVAQMASRVDGLGGDSGSIGPSPSGEGAEAGQASLICRALEIAIAMLVSSFVALTAVGSWPLLVLGLLDLLLLGALGYAWAKVCDPDWRRILLVLLAGGLLGLALALALRFFGP
jgi:hypothetical protein